MRISDVCMTTHKEKPLTSQWEKKSIRKTHIQRERKSRVE